MIRVICHSQVVPFTVGTIVFQLQAKDKLRKDVSNQYCSHFQGTISIIKVKVRLEIRTMPTHIKNKITDVLTFESDQSKSQVQASSSYIVQPTDTSK